jgi:multidrug efflux system outer membrane protein
MAALLSGCATGPNYRAPHPSELALPAQFDLGQRGQLDAAQLANWWTQFGDPVLNGVVAKAIAANLDIAVARTRLVQAHEAAIQAQAAFFPTVGASASAGRNFVSLGQDTSSFSLGANASWELDLFGGTRRTVEATRAEAEGSGYDLAAVRVSIVAETVTNYVDARLAQTQLRIDRDALASQDANLRIAHWRVMAGLVSSLDEELARTQQAQTAATIPPLEQAYRAALARIAVLSGEAPGAATRDLETVGPIPLAPAAIAAGIPADTLRQRPDVRSAERTLAAQTARIGVAQVALLPALGLTGNIGTSALRLGSLGDIFTGALFAGLTQLIFDGGAAASRVRAQRAATDGAFAAYRHAILTALEDIQNGLVAIDATASASQQLSIAQLAANNGAVLARLQYRSGLIDFQTLLTTERTLLATRNNEAAGRANRALAVVTLYRALGGGWQTSEETRQ